MLTSVIDMGSNTVRMTAYQVEGGNFQTLFSQKVMAGLAGFVKDGVLTEKGINRACETILTFHEVIENLGIEKVLIFATASLRNIKNTQEAVESIERHTGYRPEIISGEQEARMDFLGATLNVEMDHGVLIDIGGGSTEIVLYHDGEAVTPVSIPMGSLSLYTKRVKKLFPKKEEVKKMKQDIRMQLEGVSIIEMREVICGVGGTVRAVLKLHNYLYGFTNTNREITSEKLQEILELLSAGNTSAMNLILRVCPDRIHTIVPGVFILSYLCKKFRSEKIIVSSFGVREGYLFDRVLRQEKKNCD